MFRDTYPRTYISLDLKTDEARNAHYTRMARGGELPSDVENHMSKVRESLNQALGIHIRAEVLSMAQKDGMTYKGTVVQNYTDITKAWKFDFRKELMEQVFVTHWTRWDGKTSFVAQKVERDVMEAFKFKYEEDKNTDNDKNFTPARRLARVGFVMMLLRKKLRELRATYTVKNRETLHGVGLKTQVTKAEWELFGKETVKSERKKTFSMLLNVTGYDDATFDWTTYHQAVEKGKRRNDPLDLPPKGHTAAAMVDRTDGDKEASSSPPDAVVPVLQARTSGRKRNSFQPRIDSLLKTKKQKKHETNVHVIEMVSGDKDWVCLRHLRCSIDLSRKSQEIAGPKNNTTHSPEREGCPIVADMVCGKYLVETSLSNCNWN